MIFINLPPPCTLSTGCKTNNITVVYTEFENLKKTQKMDVGQVGFRDDKKVKITSLHSGLHTL